MNKLIIFLIISILISKPLKANPILKVNCEDYNLETISTIDTQTYKVSICKNNNEEIKKRYFYLGGMRKNNSDYFTLLPLINWSRNFYVAENNNYYYIIDNTKELGLFSIYEGKKLLDSESIKEFVFYE